jgi:dipeptidyl aminopeptidase/acylaminoacyl peptidase
MKLFLLFILILFAIFACTSNQSREVKQYTIEQFYKNLNILGGNFSPDEKGLLVTSNETGIYNVFNLAVDGSKPQQLTHSENESFFADSYLPNGDGFLYYADKGGDENDHIYWVNSDNKTTDLTPFEGSKSQSFSWSRDEKSLFFLSNKRNPRYFDLYEKDIEKFEDSNAIKLVFLNEDGLDVGALSKNKKFLALIKTITTNNSEMYLYDVDKEEKIHISAHSGDARYNPQFFDLATENLYYLTNENSEYMYLARYHLKSGKKDKIFETNWDVWYAYHSYNEKYRVIGINEDAITAIRVIDLKTKKQIELPEIKGGSISSVSISKSEKILRLSVGTSASPTNIYVYNIETEKLTKLTNTLNPEFDPSDLVEGQVIRYKSFDGLEIPAILYKPHVASSTNKVPGLVWVHGGPGGQSRLRYFSLIQYLVNHGYAILAVNNRGSSGYGKTFYKLDDKNHGDLDLKDCVASKKFLASTGYIDMDRVGIIGGSYGGYMVMAALAFTPDEFTVGVNIFGVTNWLRTLKSIPPYWESFREALYAELGDPFSSDSLRLFNISPLFHAKNVTKPLIVLQGANDPRVLQVESDEIVAAVRSNGVPVEYVLFEDEGHGFVKKENEIKGYGKVRVFLDTHLKGK